MSAYMVSAEHVRAMLNAGLAQAGDDPLTWQVSDNPYTERTLNRATAEAVGAMLLAQNRRSVDYRYDADELEELYTHGFSSERSPVEILKAIACYEYQASEAPDWDESETRAFCQALRLAMIRRLPGYDEADWGIDTP